MPLHKFDFSKNRIPTIERSELDRRLKLITPCFLKGNNEVRKIDNLRDPVEHSFSFEAKGDELIGYVSHGGLSVRDKPGERPDMWYMKNVAEEVGEFLTLHYCAFYGFFKPSLEEVMTQLPAELFDEKKLAKRKLYFFTKILNNEDVLHTSMVSQTWHIAKTRVYIEKI
jgi:hypothetical protein